MKRFLPLLFSAPLLLLLTGCSGLQHFSALMDTPPVPNSHMRQSALDRLASTVRKDFEQLTGSRHRDLRAEHETVEKIPAQFKHRLAVKALKDPWDGLTELEQQGLVLADMAKGGAINLPALLDTLEAGRDRTSTFYKPVSLPTSSAHEALLAFMIGSLEQASLHRRADYAGWGIFIDEGGEDQYQVNSGFGDASGKSVTGFFDLNGNDIYAPHPDSSMPPDTRPGNGKLFLYSQGGTFIDR